MARTNAIDVRNVSKSFQIPGIRRQTVREHVLGFLRPQTFERLQVLDDISFEVQRGETFGIMGRNGCGKSTLLKILCGIYEAERGTVFTAAPVTPILELGIGWNTELSAIDNILLLGTVMGMSLREAKASIDEVLAFAQLERFANLELKHFSTGMGLRLAYSVAFKAAREILVIDEVFAVGDLGFKARCEERYRQLAAQGCTTVLVSHDPNYVERYCGRAILIEGGRVTREGKGGEIARAYLERVRDAEVPRTPAAAG